MAPAVYDGAPIIHKHYDADGKLVGWTEIESPWDDDGRAEAEALHEAEMLICPRCGNPREVCSDPSRGWYPQRSVCYAEAATEAAQWQWSEKHKDAKRSKKKPNLPTDGVKVWVAAHDLTPEDKFL